MKNFLLLLFIVVTANNCCHAEDGYRLWLRYDKINDVKVLENYRKQLTSISIIGTSPTLTIAGKELEKGVSGLLDKHYNISSFTKANASLIVGNYNTLKKTIPSLSGKDIAAIGEEGYMIFTQIVSGKKNIIVTANTDIGVLYGSFAFLRMLQTDQSIENINIVSIPKLKLRLLNHWDNLNGFVERGYAGFSIFKWHLLPTYIDQRYIDYARANASIGINGVCLTNVNANAIVLTKPYLLKVKALADVFRPYGIKVYLSAKFSAPIEIGNISTADPLNDSVKTWWKNKADEIYSLIPDFGGFLVKANSEGQPGPQNYGRSHADGANLLADALAPHNGIVIWRAFVYSNENSEDRHKQAYNEFVPLDGSFRKNVMLQVKNGAIDFMPREPFHPLFGAIKKTPMMIEFQLTQEYLGQGTHLVFLAPLIKETLQSDTYSEGKGSTVQKVIDGSLYHHELNGIAAVSNIGNDINWCGHPFAQANWYALGRLAWDYDLTSADIADEWLRMTFTNDNAFVNDLKKVMLSSREILVNYMNPLGLHHIMGTGNHYGPAPWVSNLSRPEWNPVYYHKADSLGIGFDRTITGSNALAQYNEGARKRWENISTTDEKFLLWFHHVSWTYKMKSGRTLWDELCYRYYTNADSVLWIQKVWNRQKDKIDNQRYTEVSQLLMIQYDEAIWWRNACLLYFQTFSKMPILAAYPQPDKTLNYYESLHFPYAPGN